MDEDTGNASEPLGISQYLLVFEPGIVCEVVGADANEGQLCRVWLSAVLTGVAQRLMRDRVVFPDAPVPRGLFSHR